MGQGPIYEQNYRPSFSGHETFPLRYGWLKKSFDAVDRDSFLASRSIFLSPDAIAQFGVGRNMVASMRHWATCTGVISGGEEAGALRTTKLGQMLFGTSGLDPYMESPASLWLLHWQLSGRPDKTTWFWAFNYFSGTNFERETLVKALEKLARQQGWLRVATATLKRDVECFVRTYVADTSPGTAGHDDSLESPLAELALIRSIGRRAGFRFVRGPKPTLGNGVFVYALLDFWSRYTFANSLSFEAIAQAPGSPGRVFLLDENDVADRLVGLDDVTDGALRWSETAGLKQVFRRHQITAEDATLFIPADYEARQEAA
jgi:hypothetical protein